MTAARPWANRLLRYRLVQPDARSCGAASLVMGRAVRDEAYAELLVTGTHPRTGWQLPGTAHERFRAETLAMHARVTGPADLAGRLQAPWPRMLGTPPWAVARQLSAHGRAYGVRQALVGRDRLLRQVLSELDLGEPVALYVGDRWAPRHVVLAVRADDSGGFWVFDPGAGRRRPVTQDEFVSGRLPLGRWSRPWCAVLPR